MSRTGARLARRVARRLRGGPNHSVVCEPDPSNPEPLEDFRLFAVLGTWMEEDVVEANVRNALAQGVERVYLVDNHSTDRTVELALSAGAVLAESFETGNYQEHVRILLMNAVVARISLASKEQHVWWLWLDADEFPEGPDQMTIAEYLHTLDRRFRVVGSTYYNHFPTEEPAYLSGFHPVDLQPVCEQYQRDQLRFCSQAHFKHPLQRFDRDGAFVMSIIGFHSANTLAAGPLLEPVGGIVTHQAQYREEAVTRRRMERLCGTEGRNDHNNSLGNTEIKKRFESLDAVYAGRWADVDNLRSAGANRGVNPEPWPHPPAHRWYGPAQLLEAKTRWLAENSRRGDTALSRSAPN